MRELNPDLIRLVASRYDELRGLHTAGDATVLLGFSGAMFAARAMDEGRLGGLVMTMVTVALGAWLVCWAFVLRRRVDRFYACRFGRVGPKRYVPSRVMWVVVATSWMGLWCTVPGPLWVRGPLALAFVVPLLAWAGWTARRDAPYRAHWALVAIAALVVTLQLPLADAVAQPLWRTHALLSLGAALLIAGLGDHLLLTQTLKRQDHAGEESRA